MEANCLELASLISVLLKDALALIRIVNAARSTPEDKTVVTRLYQNLKALEAWAQSECHGYAPFFQAIQPQLNSLRTFLLQQSKSAQLPTPHRKSSLPPSRKTSPASTSGLHQSSGSLGNPTPKSSTASAGPGAAGTPAGMTPTGRPLFGGGHHPYKRSSTSPRLILNDELNSMKTTTKSVENLPIDEAVREDGHHDADQVFKDQQTIANAKRRSSESAIDEIDVNGEAVQDQGSACNIF